MIAAGPPRRLWLVEGGEAAPYRDWHTPLPPAATYGHEWRVVEAEDEARALGAAGAPAGGPGGRAWVALRALRAAALRAPLDGLLWHVARGRGIDDDGRLYMRFGAPDPSGRSLDFTERVRLRGLAAYDAEPAGAGLLLAPLPPPAVAPLMLRIVLHSAPYLVRGRRAGWCSDGTPLLAEFGLVARLSYQGHRAGGFRPLRHGD